jgi:hypothetical protein
MNYITQVVETIRVPNVNEVEKLHKELKDDNRFELKKFEYSHKDVKQKGEIIDEYELVKATLVFNLEKEPTSSVDIEFTVENGFFPEPIEQEED